MLTRRDLLASMLVAAGAPLVRTTSASAVQTDGMAELALCGWDEVFIVRIGRSSQPPDKVWSWRAADDSAIPAALKDAFRTTDDCKPVDDGRAILISSSSGAIALVDRATRRARFHAPVVNAHSIERLPGGRVAAAASVATAPGGNRIVVFDAASGQELASDALRSAHGLVWDDAGRRLWALGGDVLRAYDVGVAGGPTALTRIDEVPLPTRGGHDLVPLPGSPHLFFSTESGCYLFDRETRGIVPHESLGPMVNVKSYSVHVRAGRVAYIQAEGTDWWAEHVHFQRPDGQIRLPGARLYKARWL
ncbi:MAG: hypothetical protein IT184_12880 [Acidobacteria bacterium]|nr:hypothetical protein [Acidobacteriota bacterium]